MIVCVALAPAAGVKPTAQLVSGRTPASVHVEDVNVPGPSLENDTSPLGAAGAPSSASRRRTVHVVGAPSGHVTDADVARGSPAAGGERVRPQAAATAR